MSKPRYRWWSYARAMVREYPELAKKYNQPVTASCPGMPSTEQREYEAVRRAIEKTKQYKNGRDRLSVIGLVLWKKSHTIAGAALTVPCHEDTAKQWHGEFIRLVAKNMGLMD